MKANKIFDINFMKQKFNCNVQELYDVLLWCAVMHTMVLTKWNMIMKYMYNIMSKALDAVNCESVKFGLVDVFCIFLFDLYLCLLYKPIRNRYNIESIIT